MQLIADAHKQLQKAKRSLLQKKQENTRIIQTITKQGKIQMTLNRDLESTNKQIFKDESDNKRTNLSKDKRNLKELVKFFEREIEDLRTEIGLFKRKGGHLYTMFTSNKKNQMGPQS